MRVRAGSTFDHCLSVPARKHRCILASANECPSPTLESHLLWGPRFGSTEYRAVREEGVALPTRLSFVLSTRDSSFSLELLLEAKQCILFQILVTRTPAVEYVCPHFFSS